MGINFTISSIPSSWQCTHLMGKEFENVAVRSLKLLRGFRKNKQGHPHVTLNGFPPRDIHRKNGRFYAPG